MLLTLHLCWQSDWFTHSKRKHVRSARTWGPKDKSTSYLSQFIWNPAMVCQCFFPSCASLCINAKNTCFVYYLKMDLFIYHNLVLKENLSVLPPISKTIWVVFNLISTDLLTEYHACINLLDYLWFQFDNLYLICISACLSDILTWIKDHHLHLNPNKCIIYRLFCSFIMIVFFLNVITWVRIYE